MVERQRFHEYESSFCWGSRADGLSKPITNKQKRKKEKKEGQNPVRRLGTPSVMVKQTEATLIQTMHLLQSENWTVIY